MKASLTLLLAVAILLPGCKMTHTVKMEPIHMTLDINLKVDKQLDDFFDFEEEFEGEGE
jgi:hypothetical protein